jgi:hypothetical protein
MQKTEVAGILLDRLERLLATARPDVAAPHEQHVS